MFAYLPLIRNNDPHANCKRFYVSNVRRCQNAAVLVVFNSHERPQKSQNRAIWHLRTLEWLESWLSRVGDGNTCNICSDPFTSFSYFQSHSQSTRILAFNLPPSVVVVHVFVFYHTIVNWNIGYNAFSAFDYLLGFWHVLLPPHESWSPSLNSPYF